MMTVTVEFSDSEYARIVDMVGVVGVELFVRTTTCASLPKLTSETEEWRTSVHDDYEVSSHGNVRRRTPGIATFPGRPLKPVMSAGGYAMVTFGKKNKMYVHRVVAEAFCGPAVAGHVVNHIDGNKLNNAASNLEFLSPRDNVRHALTHLAPRHRGPKMPRAPLKGPQTGDDHWSRRRPDRVARGERMGGSKITAEIVTDIRSSVAQGGKQIDMARKHGISVAQVSRIVRGLRWAHIKEE